jgi:Tfp pilus assembly protein PilF
MEKDFHKVKHLFEDRPFIHNFRSQLERSPIPKQVFVDNTDDPQTAVIVVFRHGYSKIELFFGGRADNEVFNKDLRMMLYEEPILKNMEEKFVEIYCELSNNDWEEGIKSVLKDPYLYNRYYHEIKELKLKNWRDLIPEGFSIEPIDLTLMEKSHLKDDGWYNYLFYIPLRRHWFPFEEGLKENRGFILVREDEEVVSVCHLANLTKDDDIELSIGTLGEYRRRSFASIVGAATAEYCLTKFKTVGWHCTSTNVGSYKTAEKIGFGRVIEYKMASAFMNQINNWVVNGLLKSLNNFLEFDPDNPLLLNRKAFFLADLNRKEDSIKIIQDLVEREPNNGNFYDTYGGILLTFDEYEEAIVKFQKALELEPNGFFTHETYIKMGECYKELGNYDKIVEYGKKGKELAIARKEEEWIKRANKLLLEITES